jgi:epoxyqueuosine reductase
LPAGVRFPFPASAIEQVNDGYAFGIRFVPWLKVVMNREPVILLDSRRALTLQIVRDLARHARFTEAGVVALPHADTARDASRFEEWIRAGHAGTMHYLKRTNEDGELVRARVSASFPWARSAIVCLANYNSAQPRSVNTSPPNCGWIARYAWSSHIDAAGARRPSDYHKVLLKRLKQLDSKLRERLGAFESRTYVDTGPVVERSLAVAAGLGWIAKNTCLIHPQIGSFVFLAVLLTSLEFEEAERPLKVPDRCGSCTRCLDACPTNAFIAPYRMDATRCISYLTIEHRGPLDEILMHGMGRQVFGCDICQDVCPWNRRAPIHEDAELQPREELVNPALEWLANLSESDFEQKFNGSPIRRARFLGFRRNIAVAMGNSGDRAFLRRLEEWSTAADEGLRNAARWAIRKLEGARASLASE